MQPPTHLLKNTALIAIVFLAIGAFLGAFFHKETIVVREGTADTPAAMTSVNLMIDYGTGTIRTWNTISWHEAMSVLNLMETVAATHNVVLETGDQGGGQVSVKAIDGVTNDLSVRMRWQFWVNNNYEPRSASKYFLKPGDIVVWKFTTEQPKGR